MLKTKPLWRKINKTSLRTKYYVQKGGDYKHQRNNKNHDEDLIINGKMTSKNNLGRDYTPFLLFLLNSIDKNYDNVMSITKPRMDENFDRVKNWLFSDNYYVRVNENSYFSSLFNDAGVIRKINNNARQDFIKENRDMILYTQTLGFSVSFDGKLINKNEYNF